VARLYREQRLAAVENLLVVSCAGNLAICFTDSLDLFYASDGLKGIIVAIVSSFLRVP
jgi:hypothetical protein